MMLQETEEVGLVFFLKKTKKPDAKLRFIYVRVTVDGIRKEWSTKKKWYPDRWNQKIGRATDNKEDAKTLNKALEAFALTVSRTKTNLIEADKEVSSIAVKKVLTGDKDPEVTLLGEFKLHNDAMKALVGKKGGFAKGTHDRYQTSMSHTRDFIMFKYKTQDINVKSLNYEFIADFAQWLRTVRDCDHNTTMKYLSNMKKIVLLCVKKGTLPRNPFAAFPLKLLPVSRPHLSMEELMCLIGHEFISERLAIVRDIFVFACFTGLAYSDVKKLNRKDIVRLEGRNWIQMPRTKTHTECKIPILDQAQNILNRYAADMAVKTSGKFIPIRSNQKMNEYLKEIADLCGIFKALTFHIARHTFATTIAAGYGITIATLAAILGHKKLPQTQHYMVIQHRTIAKEMGKLQLELTADMEARKESGEEKNRKPKLVILADQQPIEKTAINTLLSKKPKNYCNEMRLEGERWISTAGD